ncbi:uncharacterized protein [Heptranchias perlo]|uniref:uncharacterized protein n=1 Tax=Heptranchias perlo TaxID=212740 RepID=UPI00355A1FAF
MLFESVFPLDAVTVLLLGALTIIVLVYFNTGSKSYGGTNFPPGPTPLPVIGNLHILDLKKLHKSLMELSEKYGTVFSINLGPTRVVVLTGYETVKDALVNHPDEFGERARIPIFEAILEGYGIIFGHGDSWKQIRRFTLSTLRDFGMGKKTIEDKIIEETNFLIKMFDSYKGQPFNPAIIMNSASANIICSIVFGDRFDYEDENFVNLVKRVSENIQLAGSPMVQLYNAFPFLGFLPGLHKTMLSNGRLNCALVKSYFKENRRKLDENDLRSFIDVFMVRQQKESDNPNSHFHEKNLLYTTTNLFAAGMETTSTTLRWGMLLMMKYPEIQKKVYEEILRVIGSERSPRAADRKNLPYSNAVIHETQRFGNIVPLNIPHATTVDLNFKGYFIPKETQVIPLLTSVLYDKTQWEKPDEFYPSHFLDAEENFVRRDAFMPFSTGRRACAGENLAKMELFLFFTALIQKFKFQAPLNIRELELVSGVGLTSFPQCQDVCAVRQIMSFLSLFATDVATLVLFLLFAVFCLMYFYTGYKPSAAFKLPPGPAPLPLIGNLHILDLKMLSRSLMELSEKYGSVFTIQLGLEKVVVLTGYETVKEALVDRADEFAERAKIPVLEMQADGYGISFGHGESWKQMRRFALMSLRNFGMGKKTIEDKITEEAKFLVQVIESHQGQPFDTTVTVTSAMANIICSIVFGERFDYEDKIFLTITKLIRENFNLLGTSRVQMYNAFPFLGFLPGTHKKIFENRTQMVRLILNFYKEHQKTLNVNDIGSLIDAFLVKQQEESKNSDSYFHDNNLVTSVTNLFAAGTDTSSSTLRWAILLMMKYPEIQRSVHEEIERVIGTERPPRMEDRRGMPYTDAVLHEIQRFANIIPMNIPHATTVDTHFRGFFIPKGMQVIPLLSSVLYDKTQWEKPNEFNPSHFLDAEGKFVKRDAFMPFSAGRRICIGESLARMELFLFFTTLMQRFAFHAVPGASLDLTPCVGLTLCPKPHQVCAVLC